MASLNDNFNSLIQRSIANAAQENGSVNLQIADAKWNFSIQKQQIEDYVSQSCNVLILNMVSAAKEDVTTGIQPAVKAGIPVVFVNVKPDISLGNGLYYVGSDDFDAGIIQMSYLIDYLGQNEKVAIIMGNPFSGVAQYRTNAVKKILEKRPDIQIIKIDRADFERQKAVKLVTGWLDAGVQFNAVIANNDEMALGAIQAIKKKGLSLKQIKVVGIDATEEALFALYKHELFATVFQNAQEQGRQSLIVAAALAMKEKNIKAEYMIPFQLVTVDNFRKFLRR